MPRRNLGLHGCVRCGLDSDMTRPLLQPLEEHLQTLADRGYEAHFNPIDDKAAHCPLSKCTNCGARGRFDYTGVKDKISYRAFWSCRVRSHWVEA